MIRTTSLFFLAAAASASATNGAAPPHLHSFTADYQANYMGMQASGTMALAQSVDHQWDFSFSLHNQLASLQQSTHFDEQGTQLRPLSSQTVSNVLFKRRTIQTRYDWKSHQAVWQGDIKPTRRGPVTLQEGDIDGLLINLALVRDLTSQHPMDYRMVDAGRVKNLHYAIDGQESIQVNGQMKKATRLTEHDGDKEIVVWVVADLPVPVHLLQRNHGENTMELVFTSLH